MQYSLLSRFRGTLVGAAIAEALVSRQETNARSALGKRELSSPAFEQGQSQTFQFNRVAWFYGETLIKVGDLDVESLRHYRQQQASVTVSPGEMLLGLLPVSLFFHEDEERLRQKILQVTEWHPLLELRSEALAVAYAIAQSLREQLDPATLITRTIAYLLQPSDLLIQQLEQVQILLEQRAGLETALAQLRIQPPSLPISTSIALAFYCFLSTLEDYRLTIVRAAHIGYPPLTAILAGALSGAHNSVAGIAPGNRLTLSQEIPQTVRRKTAETRILQLADQLLATWSGVYQPARTVGSDLNPEPAIAAPGVIQPR